MEIVDVITHLVVGGIFAGCGIVAIIRAQARVGFGTGAGDTPRFQIGFAGAPAAVFGLFWALGGCLFGFPSCYQLLSGTELSGGWVFWMQIAGIAMMIFAVVFGTIIQVAVSAGEHIHSRRAKQLKQDQADP